MLRERFEDAATGANDIDITYDVDRWLPMAGGVGEEYRFGDALRSAVDAWRVHGLVARRVDQVLCAELRRRPDDGCGPENVDAHRLVGVALAEGDVLVRGQVKDGARANLGK